MPYSVKGFFEINKDMVQILLMLEVLFKQDSKVEDHADSSVVLVVNVQQPLEASQLNGVHSFLLAQSGLNS